MFFSVLSKSCGLLRSQLTARNAANLRGYLQDTLQKVMLAPSKVSAKKHETQVTSIFCMLAVCEKRTETAQQIAVPHGIPWNSGKRQPPSHVYIYMCVCAHHEVLWQSIISYHSNEKQS